MKKIYSRLLAGLLFVLVTVGANAQNVAVTGADAATNAASPFPTLSAAFTSINASAQTGNVIIISIIGNTTEPAAGAILNQSTGVWTSMSIQPAGGAARTITGAVTAGSPLIDFNGADNVTVDGLNTGGNSLTISNTTVSATSNTSTLRFIGGATSNTITNCFIQGSGTMSVATNGATIFFSTDAITANGNDNNTISNNDIGPAGANLPTKGILGNGSTTTTAIGNSGNTINNNDIHDYFGAAVTSAGVATNGGCNTWIITNNRFYQTATRTWTTGANNRGIEIANSTTTSGAQGFTITGNIIGYASKTQTGTYTLTGSTGKFMGILFNGITGGVVSNINSNTVASVSLTGVTSSGTTSTSPLMGMYLQNGVIIANSNTVGSQSATGSLVLSTTTTSSTDVLGIYSFASDNLTTNSNSIGGISVTNLGASGTLIVSGIRANLLSSLTHTANFNQIGGSIANSIQLNATGTSSQVIGLIASTAIASFSGNTIRNLTTNIGTGTTTGASVIGISTGTSITPSHTLSQNTIYNLTNTNATAASIVTGIQFTGGVANIVERNFIYSLTSSTNSTTAEINGIRVGGGTTTYRNNMIAIGAGVVNAIGTAATNSNTSGVNGINEFLGTNNFFHNSVYIDGAPTAGVGAAYAFNGTQTTNTRSFRDNIFFNARSNSGATGKHYAVKINGTAPNPPGLTINNNVYFANGSGAIFGFFNSLDVANIAAWRTAVGQDVGGFESNPQYNAPGTATPDLHIHPTNATVVEGNGFDVGVTDDYDGQTRASFTPVDIGADAGNFNGVDLAPPGIVYTAFAFTCTTGDRVLTATITDATGVPTSGVLQPRIYFRKNLGTWFSNQGVLASGTGINGTWNFTIVAATMSGLVVGDNVQYYVIAQDIAATPNITSNPSVGLVATDVNTVTTHPTTPNSYNINNSLGGTYTVGAAGTYTTLTAAIAAYNTSCLTSAVVFSLIDASYTEVAAMTINANPDANAVNTLTIKPTLANTTVAVTGGSTSAIFILNGADYVTINGSISATANTVCPASAASRDLTITNTNAGTSSAVVWLQTTAGADAATNNRVINCNLTGSGVTQTLFGAGSGSATISTSSLGTANNNNSFINNNISAVQYGIYSQGASAGNKNQGTIINQNLINTSANTKGGIWTGFENSITISANNVSNIAQTSSPDVFGITLGMGTAVSATTSTGNEVTNASVTKNVIGSVVNSGTFSAVGIAVAAATSGTTLLANNMISGVASNGTAGDFGAGIILGGGTGSATNVYYNTVSMQGTITGGTAASQTSACLAVTNSTAPTLDLRNNIFSNTQVGNASATLRFASIAMAYSTFTTLTSDYNDLYCAGAGPGTYQIGITGTVVAGTNSTTLANWQATTTKDAASKNVLPVFISGNDLHLNLTSNPLLDATATPVSVTDDIDCDVRNLTTPDIGADEFTPLVITDAGVTAIVLPNPFCPGVNLVSATVKNYGSTTITSILIDWSVTPGGAQPQVNPGAISLAPGASQTFALGNFTFVAGTTYSITAFTSMPNGGADGVPGNDSYTNASITTGLVGTYTVGVGMNYTTLTAAVADYNTKSLCGAVVFSLTDATYPSETFPITINANAASSAVNTLTIKPAGSQSPTISGSSTTSIFKLNGADYVIIDGSNNGSSSKNLTIINSNTNTSGNGVIWLASATASDGATNNTVKNCIITGNATTTTLMGIFSGATTSISTSSNALIPNLNNTIQNNTVSKSQYGIFIIGVSTSSLGSGLTITGNNLGSSTAGDGFLIEGIDVRFQSGATVSNNDVQNITGTTGSNMQGINLQDSKLSTVSANKVHFMNYTGTSTTKVYGITTSTSTFNAVGNQSANTYANNIVYDLVSSATSASWNTSGINNNGGYNDKYYYNAVYLTGQVSGSTGTAGSAAFSNGNGISSTNCPVMDMQNNIFYMKGSSAAAATLYAHYTTVTTYSGSTINYNDLISSASGSATAQLGRFNATNYATLATWQAATAMDANSISVDPLFNSTTNLQPQLGSPVVNAGTPVSVTTDITGFARSVTTPTIGAYEQAGDFAAPTITYTVLSGTCSTGDRTLTATIIDASGVPTSGVLQPRIYYKKNAGAWFSSQGVLSGGTATNGTWTFAIVAADMGGVANPDVISYFVIAQDVAATPNITSNPAAGLVATNVNVVTTYPTTPNTYSIQNTLAAGTYTVGVGQTYTTLTAAVTAYNTSCLGGAIVFQLMDANYSTSETFPITVNPNASANAINTLTIRPGTGVTATVSGTVASGALLKILGNYVIINGSNNGTTSRDLTITNASVTSPNVILIGSTGLVPVTNVTVKNSIIINGINTSSAVVVSDGATIATAGYFSNITIDNNSIQKAYIGIYNIAVVAAANGTGLNITGNDLTTSGANAIAFTGIYVQGVDGATVQNNIIANFETVTSEADKGIWFATGTTNSSIKTNKIYNLQYTGTSGYGAKGIVVSTGLAAANVTVSNNMVSGITGDADSYTTFGATFTPVGIYAFGAGQGGLNIYYNSIYLTGSTLNYSAASYSIGIALDDGAAANVKNNIVYNQLGRLGATGVGGVGIAAEISIAQFTSLDYNDYFTSVPSGSNFIGKIAATNYATLASWQTITSAEANSINIAPNFTSATDLHLVAATNCRLDGYGTPIAGITTDYDLQTRDAGAPDMGVDEFTTSPAPSTMATASNCDTKNVSPSGTLYLDATCNLIAKVLPSGGSAVTGKIKTCVTLDGSQLSFNAQPYVQRHYDIEPSTSPSTATGTITLYFTDAEFALYNTNNPAWPPLPTVASGGNASIYLGNVKVTQFHGVGSTSPTSPGNYPGTTVLITPVTKFFNGAFWEITFNVTGFSGFYVHTNGFGGPLPITVNYLTGRKQGSNHLLNWKVTCATSPRATITLERSADSRNYTGIYTITADAARCNQPFDYTDATPLKGMNYYRLKIVDADGKVTYSTTVALLNAVKGFDIISIAPNPVVAGNFKLNVASAQAGIMEIVIFDMQGRLVNSQTISLIAGFNSATVNVNNLSSGTYSIKASVADDQSKVIRFVKQ